MADLSAFNNDSFDVVQWMNSSLREKSDEENLESYLASLSMKLSIISQDYTDQLETGMVEAISTIPRILSEVSRLEETLQSIDQEMTDLSEQLAALDQKNVAGIEDLSRLDMLKSNMENCKATLEEHARWSAVVREARTFLEGGGRLSDSANRVEAMYKSLEVLRNISGHEEREETYNELRDTLLNALKPQLLRDVEGSDLSPLREYLYVYEKLGKAYEFEEEYIKARPKDLLLKWTAYSPTQVPLSSWLADFSDRLITFIDHEADNIASLFIARERCSSILSAMISFILSSLSQSLSDRLVNLHSSQLAYETFIVTDNFAQRVIRYIDMTNPSKLIEVLNSIYHGYIIYADQYSDDESQNLKNHLGSILRRASFERAVSQLSDISDFDVDPYEVILSYSENLVSACEDSIEPVIECLRRAVMFMGGSRSKIVFRTAATTITMFIKSITAKVDDLRIACAVPPDSNTSSHSNKDKSAGMDESGVAESWSKKLESQDVGSKPLLPCALRALQASGRMIKRAKDLESIAIGLLSSVLGNLYRDISLDKAISLALSNGHPISSQYAAYLLQQDFTSSSELRSFLTASTSMKASHTIFSSISSPMQRLKMSAGSMLFDLCTSIPDKVLHNLHAEDIWSSQSVSSGGYDSLLPQSCFTQVGEHLLSIVQELEFFAASDALPDLLHLVGEAMHMVPVSKGWRQLKTLLSIADDDALVGICRRSSCANLIITVERSIFGSVLTRIDESENPSNLAYYNNANDNVDANEDENASWTFVNEWLGAISDAVTGLMLVQIVKMHKLSLHGKAQLIVDIDYISNVLQAMGLKQHPLVIHIHHVFSQPIATITDSIDLNPPPTAGRGTSTGALHKLDQMIIKALSQTEGSK